MSEEFAVNDLDRKSTRLNSSHGYISYAVFCLKKNGGNCFTRIHGVTSAITAAVRGRDAAAVSLTGRPPCAFERLVPTQLAVADHVFFLNVQGPPKRSPFPPPAPLRH